MADAGLPIAALAAALVAGLLWRTLARARDQRRAEARHNARQMDEARAQLAGFFDHVPVMMSLHGLDGRFIFGTEQVHKSYGLTAEELAARDMRSLAPHWPRFEELTAATVRAVTEGQAQRIETPFIGSPDRAEQIFDVVVFPIRSAEGTIVQVGSLGIDITALKQAQTALTAERAALRALFDYAPLQIYVTELDHKLIMLNDWVFRETGIAQYHPSNVVGLSADLMVPTSWADTSHDNDAKVINQGNVTQVEVRGEFGGKLRDIISIRFPIKDDDGNVFRIGGFVVDVSAQKRAEAAVVQQQAQLHQSEKLAALGQLLAGVAHELNNPLTVVVGRSAILAEKLAGTPHAKAIADLREAADRCNRIVKTFLAMARQSAPRRAAVQINDTIEAALDMVAYNLRSVGVELVRNLDPALPEIEADEDQLVQVFTNLMINAGHALDGRREGAQITISTRVGSGQVLAEFSDNGPGVPGDMVTRIFEPFFTTKAVGEGTGMGLAMAKGMIEEHGGTLSYADAPNGGAMFTVALPISISPTDRAEQAQEATASGKGQGSVLIVDDEPAIRAMLAEILEGIGLDCVQCGNGVEALARLDRQSFDLIFCDVRMPVMDGVRFREQLVQAHPAMLGRLVFMSGDVLQRDAARFAAIADHPFVDKPFNPAEVRARALAMLAAQGEKQ
jgi:PAS domain S-box-containing protein